MIDSPVIVCANRLLVDMVEDGAMSRTVRSSDQLEVPFESVANRFKVMGHIAPQHYPDPIEAHFKVCTHGQIVSFSAHFEDGGEDPWFQITATKKEEVPKLNALEVLEPPDTFQDS